jgi:hypothetical protein
MFSPYEMSGIPQTLDAYRHLNKVIGLNNRYAFIYQKGATNE